MSFLDDQATGQIGIGEKANLSTLTRRKRKRKKGQAPTGSETYSLMPQNEFSNIVSSPTDIQQVGIGNLLQAQGSSAGKVPNVFEEYKSAAPIGSTIDAIYPQPEDDEEDDDEEEDAGTTDKLPDISPDTGFDDPESPNYQDVFGRGDGSFAKGALELDPEGFWGQILGKGSPLDKITTKANELLGRVEPVVPTKNVPVTRDPGGKVRDAAAAAARVAGYNFDTTTPTGQTVPTTESSGRTVTVGAMQGTPFGSTPDAGDVPDVPDAPDAPDASDYSSYEVGSVDYDFMASGGTIKAKNKNSFMSMKGK